MRCSSNSILVGLASVMILIATMTQSERRLVLERVELQQESDYNKRVSVYYRNSNSNSNGSVEQANKHKSGKVESAEWCLRKS